MAIVLSAGPASAPHSALPAGPRRLSLVLLLALVAATAASAQQDEDEYVNPVRPGLVATYRDARGQVTLLDSRLAFRLEEGEAPHPWTSAESFEVQWQGQFDVKRPGSYRFSGRAIGRFELSVAGKIVLQLDSADTSQGATAQGPPVELPYGPVPLQARFQRQHPSRAELRVFWHREGDFRESLVPSALGHLANQQTGEVEHAGQVEWGRRLAAELRCTKCHAPDNGSDLLGLRVDRGPALTGIGSRVETAWLYHWLDRPSAWRATAMPAMFGDGPTERADLYAATMFLAAQQQVAAAAATSRPAAVTDGAADRRDQPAAAAAPAGPRRDGRTTFAAVGCIACHAAPDEDMPAGQSADPVLGPLRRLGGLGSKTTADEIARRIINPAEHHPDSRMPRFVTAADGPAPAWVAAVAAYLAKSRRDDFEQLPPPPPDAVLSSRLAALVTDQAERNAVAALPVQRQWQALGRVVVESRGCLNCHELEGGRSLAPPATHWLDLPRRLALAPPRGCLGDAAREGAADFQLDAQRRAAIVAWLTASAAVATASHAPLYAAEVELDRLGCTACHERNGRGGRFAARYTDFIPLGTDQTIRDVAPPELTNLGEKLHPQAIERVLTGGVRARPWMPLRMPEFARHHIDGLAAELVSSDGLDPRARPPRTPAPDESQLAVGRLLLGRTGMNCVSCHDVLGQPSTGVRGPDLAQVSARVTRDWFQQWMLDPQRITAGTRMPTVFFGGRSAAPQYLDGDPAAQIEALWACLSLGEKMPLPIMAPPLDLAVEGGENPRFTPDDRPILARGFMPDVAGLKGIALGTPEQTHFAYDSEDCRLAAAWTGDFAEVGGWYDSGRGSMHDNALRPLGRIFWRGPRHPLVSRPPGDDAAAAWSPPDKHRHLACWALPADSGFAYELAWPDGPVRQIDERLAPLGRAALLGFRRALSASGPPPLALVVADDSPPLNKLWLFDAQGRPVVAGDSSSHVAAAAARWVAVPDGRRTLLVGASAADGRTGWAVVPITPRDPAPQRAAPNRPSASLVLVGGAPGPAGWTVELIYVVLDSSEQSAAVEAVKQLAAPPPATSDPRPSAGR